MREGAAKEAVTRAQRRLLKRVSSFLPTDRNSSQSPIARNLGGRDEYEEDELAEYSGDEKRIEKAKRAAEKISEKRHAIQRRGEA